MFNYDSVLQIELGEAATYQCPCCSSESVSVHGFIYDTTGETAVYFAGFTHGHPERRAGVALSVGGWGDGTTSDDRKSIAMQVVSMSTEMEYTFPPAETSPWFEVEMLGAMVSPDELSGEERQRYRDLARLVVAKDPRVAGYFLRG